MGPKERNGIGRDRKSAIAVPQRNVRGGAPSTRKSGMTTRSARSAARERVGRYGHWILVVLLAMLFGQIYRQQSEFNRQSDSHPVAPVMSDHKVPTPVEAGAISGEAQRLKEPYVPDVAVSSRVESPSISQDGLQRIEESRENVPESTSLIIEPSDNGAYYVRGTINQQEVLFLVDTGSSWISIPERLRPTLKLDRGRYVQVSTASGVVGNYETVIGSLALGPLQFRNVSGALNPYAPNDVVLLGMSALKDLQIVQNEGRLILTQQQQAMPPIDAASAPLPGEALVMRRSLRECMRPGQVIDHSTVDCLEGR